jgi:hypothetical protein
VLLDLKGKSEPVTARIVEIQPPVFVPSAVDELVNRLRHHDLARFGVLLQPRGGADDVDNGREVLERWYRKDTHDTKTEEE